VLSVCGRRRGVTCANAVRGQAPQFGGLRRLAQGVGIDAADDDGHGLPMAPGLAPRPWAGSRCRGGPGGAARAANNANGPSQSNDSRNK
jgi:hypothetical protein